jgi:hypothetical protein
MVIVVVVVAVGHSSHPLFVWWSDSQHSTAQHSTARSKLSLLLFLLEGRLSEVGCPVPRALHHHHSLVPNGAWAHKRSHRPLPQPMPAFTQSIQRTAPTTLACLQITHRPNHAALRARASPEWQTARAAPIRLAFLFPVLIRVGLALLACIIVIIIVPG